MREQVTSERDEKRPLCIAALQMVSCCDLETNLQVAEELIDEAVEQGAKMVVLPENFAVFGVRDLYSCGLEEATPAGPIRGFLRQMAQRYGIWLVGGTLPTTQPHPQIAARAEPADDSGVSAAETVVSAPQNRVYAACFVVNSAGEEVGRYDKIHLFDVDVGRRQERYRESESFFHGGCPVVVDTPWGRLGLAICYDIRFPEYFRLLMDRGAELVAIPSAFTYVTGKAHWQILLQARAIENLCFMVGASQGGEHENRRRTWGGSAIVSPWGEMLTERGQGEGIVIADIDLAEVAQARRRMPIHDHRQFTVVDL